MKYKKLFESNFIGNLKIKNKIIFPAYSTNFGTPFGEVTDKTIDYYKERARGGAGLITVENACVDYPRGKNSVRSDGHFDFVNKAWHDILGYAKKELSKLSLFDIIHPESLEYCKKMFKKVLAGESVTNVETRFIAKDGSAVFVEGNAAGRYIDGKLVATHGFFRDVTERKRAEEDLQQSFEKLRKAMEGTIQTMTLTVEARDPYTAGHQRRVTNLACAIAEEMCLSKEQIEGIRMCC